MAHKCNPLTEAAKAAPCPLYRPPKTCEILGITKTTLYTLCKTDPTFPQPIRIGSRCTAWRGDELQAWIDSRSRVTLQEAEA